MTDHPAVTEIQAVATELLDRAGEHPSHRAARTLVTGTSLRVTLIALAEGAELAEHDSPTAATLQVLTGRVRLRTNSQEWTLDSGRLATIPPERHGLHAITDAAVLLTVALR